MLCKTSLRRKGERNGEQLREPCLSCTVHLSAPEKASKPFPRISIRNGFTRPTGDINVNSSLFTKRPSREENLTENLCNLPFFFRRPAHSEAPSSSSMASDTGAPVTFPHCKQRSRLFEAMEPPTSKRPRKGKTSIRKFGFFGKFAKPRGSHRGKIGSSLH